MKIALSFALVLACAPTAAPSSSPAQSPAGSSEASQRGFEQLQTLVGTWESPTEGGDAIRVTYRLASYGSILVQTFGSASGDDVTFTIFHLDGEHLMATHYCAQGNQPRLRLDPTATAEDGNLVFEYLDATNLAGPAAAHLVRLEFAFDGADRYSQIETYTAEGKADVTTRVFQRQR
ncbi:hypothetical protein ACNOYE_36025 [Nannocystaceae bacterium ST9]